MTIQRAGLGILFGAAMYLSSVAVMGHGSMGVAREAALLALATICACHAIGGYLDLGTGSADIGASEKFSLGRAVASLCITLASAGLAMALAIARPISFTPDFGNLVLTISLGVSFFGLAIAFWRGRRTFVRNSTIHSNNRTLA